MSVSIARVLSFLCLFFSLAAVVASQRVEHNDGCNESRCSQNGPPIKFPFRLKDSVASQPDDGGACSYPGLDLFCIGNETALELPVSLPIKYQLFVSRIDYVSREIYVYNRDKCGLEEDYLKLFMNLTTFPAPFVFYSIGSTLFKCPSARGSGALDSNRSCQMSEPGHYMTALPSKAGAELNLPELMSCFKMYDIPLVPFTILEFLLNKESDSYYSRIGWYKPDCTRCEAKGKRCRFKRPGGQDDETECYDLPSTTKKGLSKYQILVTAGTIVGSFFAILAAIALFHLYNLDKNQRENRRRIKIFLDDYKAFKPSRYTYSDIKKITNYFKDKLGEGAYGTVFKGKLSNDILVAVKILNISKGNGEDFINEVSTIGRIHHVNVVRLVGYCADGFKRALVYEFLPNDSLEKYITSAPRGVNHALSWETLHDIALGIAKGIEYLHQGCDQRILHFDIKPHNVLLDRNFTPKISDFGMAKLCSKDQSIVSMTTARGTLGYIAPEVLSRNFGNVSYKSDVYSFGMLLLETVGGRKSTNVVDENTEHIYYPEWIYNLLEEGEDLRIHIEEEGDAKIAKKLAILGLWCIQWHPVSRPTMKAVVQMLEGGEELTMPPNPFASSGPSNTKLPKKRKALELEAVAE